MEANPSRMSVLVALSALHAISGRQAIISTQLTELIEATNVQQSDNLIECLSELFQPLFDDMAEIRTLSEQLTREGRAER